MSDPLPDTPILDCIAAQKDTLIRQGLTPKYCLIGITAYRELCVVLARIHGGACPILTSLAGIEFIVDPLDREGVIVVCSPEQETMYCPLRD